MSVPQQSLNEEDGYRQITAMIVGIVWTLIIVAVVIVAMTISIHGDSGDSKDLVTGIVIALPLLLIALFLSRTEAYRWRRAEDEDKSWYYEVYIEVFPKGRYVDKARARIAVLAAEYDDDQWSLAREENKVDEYEKYIKAFPKGRHVDEARARIAALPEEHAAARQMIARRLQELKKEDSLGGTIVNHFVNLPQEERLVVCLVVVRDGRWPNEYESLPSDHVVGNAKNALSRFADLIGAEVTTEVDSGPPFDMLTLVLRYVPKLYGSYKLEGSLRSKFGARTEGISFSGTISLYMPQSEVPDKVCKTDGTPSSHTKFLDLDTITNKETLKKELFFSSLGSLQRGLLRLLEFELIQSLRKDSYPVTSLDSSH